MDSEVCVLCGTENKKQIADHLKNVYKTSTYELDMTQFCPVLIYEEVESLKIGVNRVCFSRKKCRQRQQNKNGN